MRVEVGGLIEIQTPDGPKPQAAYLVRPYRLDGSMARGVKWFDTDTHQAGVIPLDAAWNQTAGESVVDATGWSFTRNDGAPHEPI